jgi:hypothetical protein
MRILGKCSEVVNRVQLLPRFLSTKPSTVTKEYNPTTSNNSDSISIAKSFLTDVNDNDISKETILVESKYVKVFYVMPYQPCF